MKNKNDKVALNDELLNNVVGGADHDDEDFGRPTDYQPPPLYSLIHSVCGKEFVYDTEYPEFCACCGLPWYIKED